MFDPAAHLNAPSVVPRDDAFRNLMRLSIGLQILLILYTVHSFYRFVPWWFEPHNVNHLEIRQQMGGLILNLIPWFFLLAAALTAIGFLNTFKHNKTFTFEGGQQLMRCAWLASVCQITTMLARPVTQCVVNQTLEFEFNPLNWQFSQRDPVAVIFCLALLMFAYVHRWMLAVTQENAEFI
jgi:hypothetical protein